MVQDDFDASQLHFFFENLNSIYLRVQLDFCYQTKFVFYKMRRKNKSSNQTEIFYEKASSEVQRKFLPKNSSPAKMLESVY